VSEWAWGYDPNEESVVAGLPPDVIFEVEQIAAELALVNSLVFLEGTAYQGTGPSMRSVARSDLLIWYTTYPRLEKVYIVRVQHFA
jgi:hypothetical protein